MFLQVNDDGYGPLDAWKAARQKGTWNKTEAERGISVELIGP